MDAVDKIKRLGSYIRETRKQQGIRTVKELAERSGIGISYLSNIERGYVNPNRGAVIPSDAVLEAVAMGMGIPVSALHAQLGRTVGKTDPGIDDALTPIERDPIIEELAAARATGAYDDPYWQRDVAHYIRFRSQIDNEFREERGPALNEKIATLLRGYLHAIGRQKLLKLQDVHRSDNSVRPYRVTAQIALPPNDAITDGRFEVNPDTGDIRQVE